MEELLPYTSPSSTAAAGASSSDEEKEEYKEEEEDDEEEGNTGMEGRPNISPAAVEKMFLAFPLAAETSSVSVAEKPKRTTENVELMSVVQGEAEEKT